MVLYFSGTGNSRYIAQRIAEAEKLGFKRMLVPSGSIKGLEQQPQNMELVPVARVEEALRQLFG